MLFFVDYITRMFILITSVQRGGAFMLLCPLQRHYVLRCREDVENVHLPEVRV